MCFSLYSCMFRESSIDEILTPVMNYSQTDIVLQNNAPATKPSLPTEGITTKAPEFASIAEQRAKEEAEKAATEARAKAEAEARAREETENAVALAKAEALLNDTPPVQEIAKNILADSKLMKTITVEQLKEYIAQKVDVNAHDDKGTTVLMMAALYSSNPQILATLIDNGAELESKRENGWTALTIAARYNSNPEVINVLIDKGATISNGNQLLGLLDKNPRIIRNRAYQDLNDRINDTISQ